MADNVAITAGTGTTVLADELTDGTLGSGKAQFVKIMDGTLDSSNKMVINSNGALKAVLYDSSGTEVTSPTAGQKTMSGSTPVAIASDQSLIAVVVDSTKIGGGASNTTVSPQFATFTKSSSGNNNILAAAGASKVTRVLAYSLSNSGGSSVTTKWVTDAGGTPADISGKKYLPNAGDGFVQGYNPIGWFQTGTNKTLDLNLSGANEVSGEIVYIQL